MITQWYRTGKIGTKIVCILREDAVKINSGEWGGPTRNTTSVKEFTAKISS